MIGSYVTLVIATADLAINNPQLGDAFEWGDKYSSISVATASSAVEPFLVQDRLALATLTFTNPAASGTVVSIGSNVSVTWTTTLLLSSNTVSFYLYDFASWSFFPLAMNVNPTTGSLPVAVPATAAGGSVFMVGDEVMPFSSAWTIFAVLDSNYAVNFFGASPRRAPRAQLSTVSIARCSARAARRARNCEHTDSIAGRFLRRAPTT